MLMDPFRRSSTSLRPENEASRIRSVVGVAAYEKFLGVMEGCTRVNIARRKL
jgi:hypothetical protein